MKLHHLDRSINWSAHVPYFLYKAGAMQGWVNQYKAVSNQEYNNGQFNHRQVAFVNDLWDDPKTTVVPTAPALTFKLETDGTSAPSYQSSKKLDNYLLKNKDQPWSSEDAAEMVTRPVSRSNQPNVGEWNNRGPPMFIDYDPSVAKGYENLIFISAETKSKEDILCNDKARNTRFDSRNFPANANQDKSTYQLLGIVNNGLVQTQVKSLNDLDLHDKDGNPITQEWLEEQLMYMNGQKTISAGPDKPAFTARTTQVRHLKHTENIDFSVKI